VKSGENFYLKSLFSRSYSRDRGPGVPGAHLFHDRDDVAKLFGMEFEGQNSKFKSS
jgi:hypothetical protein